MKILILGGLGYVGGRLSQYWHKHRKDVCQLISSSNPSKVNSSDCYYLDLSDKDSIDKTIHDVSPDVIIHLAGLNQQQCEIDLDQTNQINVLGTKHVLESAKTCGVSKVIYMSTFQVYGALVGTITEQTPLNPINAYGRCKSEAEKYVFSYNSEDMNTVVLRLSNGFGCPINTDVNVWHLVFNAFCKSCVQGDPITIRSNQYRNFITLADVVSAIDHFVFADASKEHNVFNLGGPSIWSIKQVAQKVAQLYQDRFNKEIKIELLNEHERFDTFEYSIQRLLDTGFVHKNDVDTEILKTFDLLS